MYPGVSGQSARITARENPVSAARLRRAMYVSVRVYQHDLCQASANRASRAQHDPSGARAILHDPRRFRDKPAARSGTITQAPGLSGSRRSCSATAASPSSACSPAPAAPKSPRWIRATSTPTGRPNAATGVVEEWEECDDGELNSDAGPCSNDCIRVGCGNGLSDEGEECDDGDQNLDQDYGQLRLLVLPSLALDVDDAGVLDVHVPHRERCNLGDTGSCVLRSLHRSRRGNRLVLRSFQGLAYSAGIFCCLKRGGEWGSHPRWAMNDVTARRPTRQLPSCPRSSQRPRRCGCSASPRTRCTATLARGESPARSRSAAVGAFDGRNS